MSVHKDNAMIWSSHYRAARDRPLPVPNPRPILEAPRVLELGAVLSDR
jgi:hypothetical protein